MFKNNPDKVPQILLIVLIVITLSVIASGWYHSGGNSVPAKTQAVESPSK